MSFLNGAYTSHRRTYILAAFRLPHDAGNGLRVVETREREAQVKAANRLE